MFGSILICGWWAMVWLCLCLASSPQKKKNMRELRRVFPLMSVYPLWKILRIGTDFFLCLHIWLWEIKSRCWTFGKRSGQKLSYKNKSVTARHVRNYDGILLGWITIVSFTPLCAAWGSWRQPPFSFLSPDSSSSHNCLCTAESYRHTHFNHTPHRAICANTDSLNYKTRNN